MDPPREGGRLEDPREVSSGPTEGLGLGEAGVAGQGVGHGKDTPRVATVTGVLGGVSCGLSRGQGLERLTGQGKGRPGSGLQPWKGRRERGHQPGRHGCPNRPGVAGRAQEAKEPTGAQKEKARSTGEGRSQEGLKGRPHLSADSRRERQGWRHTGRRGHCHHAGVTRGSGPALGPRMWALTVVVVGDHVAIPVVREQRGWQGLQRQLCGGGRQGWA